MRKMILRKISLRKIKKTRLLKGGCIYETEFTGSTVSQRIDEAIS